MRGDKTLNVRLAVGGASMCQGRQQPKKLRETPRRRLYIFGPGGTIDEV
jgi:hypothetical protein